MMRVLLVAPSQASLPQSSQEVEAVVNSGLGVRLLQANVSQRDLVSELSTPGRYDVLWFATHGDVKGILLSDSTLSPSAITSLIRGSGIKLVFINTCSSVATASAIQNEANVDVICTITDVPDIDAYRTGALFAAKLVQTGELRKSYEQSKPGHNSTYIYLSGSGPTQNGESEFGQLRKKVDELENAARLRDAGAVKKKAIECSEILDEINRHSGEITEIKNRLTVVEYKQNPGKRVWFWRACALVTFIVFCAILLIPSLSGIVFFRFGLGIFIEIAVLTLAVMFVQASLLSSERQVDAKRE